MIPRCTIPSFAPLCGYVAEGVRAVYLLDREALESVSRTADGRVSGLRRTGDFVPLAPRPGTASLTVTHDRGRLYTSTVELYTGAIDGTTLEALDLGTHRRHVVLLLTEGGRWLLLGLGEGAALTWRAATGEGAAAAVTLTEQATAPPAEAEPGLLTAPGWVARYVPSYEGATCWVAQGVGTPFRRATLAARVTDPGGEALDIGGVLCSVSGRRQAVLLPSGGTNPDPARYEVAGYYSAGAIVGGRPTVRYDAECAAPYVYLAQWGTTEVLRVLPAEGGSGEIEILSNDKILIDSI